MNTDYVSYGSGSNLFNVACMIDTKPAYLARWPRGTFLNVSRCALKFRKAKATKARVLKFLYEEVFAAATTKTNEILIALTAV